MGAPAVGPTARPSAWVTGACTHSRIAYGDSIQRANLDVLEPARRSVILQANVAVFGMVLVGDIEFMRRPIGPFVRLSELIQID